MANYSGMGIDLPFSASGDLGSYQFFFVKCASTSGRVDVATGGSDPLPIGVLQNDPFSGDLATVRVAGISKVYVSGSVAIQVGNLLNVSGCGSVEVVNSDASAFVAIALEDITAGAGGYIAALLRPSTSLVSGTK